MPAVVYFFNLPVAALHPPLVVVMTEEWANVIFFPFKRGTDLLVNSVEFSHVPLIEGNRISLSLLAFLLLFTNLAGAALEAITFLSYGGMEVSKETLKGQILTDYEVFRKENKRLQAELRRRSSKRAAL